MASSLSPWGGWGTKLNVTSIVSQGLEQVRNLREDVEKSFDQVVAGAPGAPSLQQCTIEKDREMPLNVKEDDDETGEEKIEKERDEDRDEEKPLESGNQQEPLQESTDDGAEEAEEGVEEKEKEENDENKEMEEEKNEGIEEEKVEEENDGVAMEEREGNALETDNSGVTLADLSLVGLQEELKVRESQLLAASTTIRELHDELDKTCHREVVAVERAQVLTEQVETMRREVAKLTQLHRDTSHRQDAQVQALQGALAEKEERLKALLDEGQTLSLKQAQLEQRVRALRREKDELEGRAAKAEAQAQAAALENEQLLIKSKKSDEETTRVWQENRQLKSSVESWTSRVEKAEDRAMEATQEVEKLQRQVEQLTLADARKDEERRRLWTRCEAYEAQHLETMELQETLQLLQETVHVVEQEAARREEMARLEIADWKRKWQQAVARVDRMGQSVSEATQPLLDQLHALQDEQRDRETRWKRMEKTLEARVEEATQKQEKVEQEKRKLALQVRKLERKGEENDAEMKRLVRELACAQEAREKAKKEALEWKKQVEIVQRKVEELQEKHEKAVRAKEEVEMRLNEAETRIEAMETSCKTSVEVEASREREHQLEEELEWHQHELKRLKSAMTAVPVSRGALEKESDELCSQASILKTTLETATSGDSSFLSNSETKTSILGLNQLQQRLRLREGENRLLKRQVEALEAREKQVKDEMVRLSTRNAILESSEVKREQAARELSEVKQHQMVLLELFGEKEEQVEELQAEVKELKAFYRNQLDVLATQHEQQAK